METFHILTDPSDRAV